MAGEAGRSIILRWDGVQLKGVREKGITFNGEAINVTSDEDLGWRTLLNVSAEDSVDITVSGVIKDTVLRRARFDTSGVLRMKEAELEYADGSIISGIFFLATYAETGPYNDALTFTATLQSNGVVEYTEA